MRGMKRLELQTGNSPWNITKEKRSKIPEIHHRTRIKREKGEIQGSSQNSVLWWGRIINVFWGLGGDDDGDGGGDVPMDYFAHVETSSSFLSQRCFCLCLRCGLKTTREEDRITGLRGGFLNI